MIKFIDLFAGMGGMRLGLTNACTRLDIESKCVLTADIKAEAQYVLQKNFTHDNFANDVQTIKESDIPNFDIMLAGFPCQPFSTAGLQRGFNDTRGTLFFDIERILKEKKPSYFILENVENLEKHDNGNTLKVILNALTNLGYYISYKVLDSSDFGVAQRRKRIYIVGSMKKKFNFENIKMQNKVSFSTVKENIPSTDDCAFSKQILKYFKPEELHGKSVKDKRGGKNNIHSWEFRIKGDISDKQVLVLSELLKERRKKKWAIEHGIEWMDGMPLTIEQIKTFCDYEDLENMCEDLVKKGYLKLEHPKAKVLTDVNGKMVHKRIQDPSKPLGYNIVTGKLSFKFTSFLEPSNITPTLVATDMHKIGVVEETHIRTLTVNESKKLFGYNENYCFGDLKEAQIFDLFGNTVVVNVVEEIAYELLKTHHLGNN